MIKNIALTLLSVLAGFLLLAPLGAVGELSPEFDCLASIGAHGHAGDGMEAVYASPLQRAICAAS